MASRAQPVLWRETVKAGAVRSGALVAALILFAVTLMLVLALASYRASDPALNTASGAAPANWMGHPGAWVADIALTLLGPAVALILPIGPIIGTRLWRDRPAGRWVKMLRQAVLGVAGRGVVRGSEVGRVEVRRGAAGRGEFWQARRGEAG